MNREMKSHYEDMVNACRENAVMGITAEQAQAEREEVELKVLASGYTIRWDREARMFRIVAAKGFRAFIKRIVK